MKVIDHYRPGGRRLALLLECRCTRMLHSRKTKAVPAGWPCRKHDPGKGKRAGNGSPRVLPRSGFSMPVLREADYPMEGGREVAHRLPTLDQLLSLIGGGDKRLAEAAAKIIGAGIRARRTSRIAGEVR